VLLYALYEYRGPFHQHVTLTYFRNERTNEPEKLRSLYYFSRRTCYYFGIFLICSGWKEGCAAGGIIIPYSTWDSNRNLHFLERLMSFQSFLYRVTDAPRFLLSTSRNWNLRSAVKPRARAKWIGNREIVSRSHDNTSSSSSFSLTSPQYQSRESWLATAAESTRGKSVPLVSRVWLNEE